MKKILLVAVLSAFAVTGLKAQTVTYINQTTPVVENSISVGTLGVDGTSTDVVVGYDFFATQLGNTQGSGVDISLLPSFVTSITPTGSPFGAAGSYSTITIGGTPYDSSGVTYVSSNNYVNLATIDLNANTPATFTLSLLGGNTNDPGNDSLYQVTLYNSLNVALSGPEQINTTTNNSSTPANDFYSATISGAGNGDYLIVAAQTNPSNKENATLGGVVLSEATTPEPSTYALLGAGLGLLLLGQRLRRNNA